MFALIMFSAIEQVQVIPKCSSHKRKYSHLRVVHREVELIVQFLFVEVEVLETSTASRRVADRVDSSPLGRHGYNDSRQSTLISDILTFTRSSYSSHNNQTSALKQRKGCGIW